MGGTSAGGTSPQVNSKTVTLSSVAELGEEAMELVRPELHPLDLVSLLMEKALFPDAVRFIAHALPKREAVWWGWACARRSAGENPPPNIKAALDATERWIAQPTEDYRRQAMAAAQKADLGTAAGCCGLAAFFSGGSLGPPEAPPVPPGEYPHRQSGGRRRDLRRRRPNNPNSPPKNSAASSPRASKSPTGSKYGSLAAKGESLWECRPSRISDMHVCPMVTGIVPHVGGPILPPGGITVLIGGLPAARVTDMAVCVGPPDVIVLGSFTVLTMGMPQARIGDMTAHGGAIVMGFPTVLVG